MSDDVEAAARRIAWLMELRNIILNSVDRWRKCAIWAGRAVWIYRWMVWIEEWERSAIEKTASPVHTGTQSFVKMSDDDMEDCESQGGCRSMSGE